MSNYKQLAFTKIAAGKEQWGVEAQGLEASLLEFYNANSIAKLHVR